jgi:hypothetical protein
MCTRIGNSPAACSSSIVVFLQPVASMTCESRSMRKDEDWAGTPAAWRPGTPVQPLMWPSYSLCAVFPREVLVMLGHRAAIGFRSGVREEFEVR